MVACFAASGFVLKNKKNSPKFLSIVSIVHLRNFNKKDVFEGEKLGTIHIIIKMDPIDREISYRTARKSKNKIGTAKTSQLQHKLVFFYLWKV